MYSLLKQPRSKVESTVEASTFVVALAIAETFYKFHSFSLECLAFFATWICSSALINLMVSRGDAK